MIGSPFLCPPASKTKNKIVLKSSKGSNIEQGSIFGTEITKFLGFARAGNGENVENLATLVK